MDDTGSNPVGATITPPRASLGIVRNKQDTDRNNLYKNNGLYAQIAQLAEHPLHTRTVSGSNPLLGTILLSFHFLTTDLSKS